MAKQRRYSGWAGITKALVAAATVRHESDRQRQRWLDRRDRCLGARRRFTSSTAQLHAKGQSGCVPRDQYVEEPFAKPLGTGLRLLPTMLVASGAFAVLSAAREAATAATRMSLSGYELPVRRRRWVRHWLRNYEIWHAGNSSLRLRGRLINPTGVCDDSAASDRAYAWSISRVAPCVTICWARHVVGHGRTGRSHAEERGARLHQAATSSCDPCECLRAGYWWWKRTRRSCLASRTSRTRRSYLASRTSRTRRSCLTLGPRAPGGPRRPGAPVGPVAPPRAGRTRLAHESRPAPRAGGAMGPCWTNA